jgi:type I restriction-modification system DNA methylase subunit
MFGVNTEKGLFNSTSEGGFDVVIGNPPYVNVKNNKTYSNFNTFQCLELYSYFFEKGINLLKQNGVISFITGSLYIKGVKFQLLRKYLTTNTKLLHLINEGDKIFENVKMPTSVFIGKKDKNFEWRFENINAEFSLLKRIEENTISISQISKIMRGLEFGRDKIKNSGEVPFISGSDICKYGITKTSYIDNKTLNEFSKEKLFFENERILIRETGGVITALYLDNLLYSNRSLFSILITDKRFDAKFVLGCLNSKVLQFYYQTKFKAETELFPKIRIIQVKELPIPIVEKSEQQPIIDIVNEILAIKNCRDVINHVSTKDTVELERKIDVLVYELYGLTEDEIKVIEKI